MKRAISRSWPLLMGVALACEGELHRPAPPAPTQLVTTNLWSGGEAIITSHGFDPPADLPVVYLDSAELAVRRVDDTTAAARLPHRTGAYTLSATASGADTLVAAVQLYGYVETVEGPYLSGFVVPHPGGGPRVVGAGDTGAVVVDVRTNSVVLQLSDTAHSSDCSWGVGPSYRAGHVLLFGKRAGQCWLPRSWRFDSGPVARDSLVGPTPNLYTWVLAELGPGTSIGSTDENLYVYACPAACGGYAWKSWSGVVGATVAPGGSRTVLHHWRGSYGPGVLDENGDSVYKMPGLWGVSDAVFGSSGDTLFAAGSGPPDYQDRLIAVNRETGAGLNSVVLQEVVDSPRTYVSFDTDALALDPVRHWLYVFGQFRVDAQPSAQWLRILAIFESSTLQPIAVLRGPPNPYPSFETGQARIVPDPDVGLVHVVWTEQGYYLHGVRSRIFRFALVP